MGEYPDEQESSQIQAPMEDTANDFEMVDQEILTRHPMKMWKQTKEI